MEEKNVQRLVEFGKQFSDSIGRLADNLEKNQENLADLAQQRSGQLSPTASTGATFAPGPSAGTARMGGTATGGGFSGGNYSGGGYSGGPSIATESGVQPPAPAAPQDSFERQYVKAQRRIGQIPIGARQWLGYFAEGGPEEGEYDKYAGLRKQAAHWNENLFRSQAVVANAKLGYGGLQSIFASVAGPTMLGQQLGASREGWFGSGLMSPAFRAGFRESWKTALSADFGFNPNYSMQQAAAARQATQSFGYSGQMADSINEQMKQLQIHQQLDPNMIMSALDPTLRFGSFQSAGSLLSVLRGIPDAAKAASMNLKTFNEDLLSTATSVAQNTGMNPGQVIGALSAFSAATGMAPQRAAGLFTNDNMTLAAAYTGKTMTELVEHPSAAPEMAFGLSLFKQMTGMDAKHLLNLRKTNRAQYNQLMDGVYRLYESDKNIFGGFDPLTLINQSIRNSGNTRGHIAATQQLFELDASKPGSVDRMQGILNYYGQGTGKQFAEWKRDYLLHHAVNSSAQMAKFRKEADTKARSLLAGTQRKQGRKAAAEITLSPEARKWFEILTKQTGGDTSNRNQNPGFWRKAMNFEKSPYGVAAGIASGGVTEIPLLGDEIANLF